MKALASRKSTEFSFLAWLQALSMIAVALGLVAGALLGSEDGEFGDIYEA
jgi:hypothetical protein